MNSNFIELRDDQVQLLENIAPSLHELIKFF